MTQELALQSPERVTSDRAGVNLEVAERAAADFLTALGIERILGLSKLARLVEHEDHHE